MHKICRTRVHRSHIVRSYQLRTLSIESTDSHPILTHVNFNTRGINVIDVANVILHRPTVGATLISAATADVLTIKV